LMLPVRVVDVGTLIGPSSPPKSFVQPINANKVRDNNNFFISLS
jgi:hypothetical protein